MVGFPTFVILETFPNHAEGEYENERSDCGVGFEWRNKGDALEYGTDEKINVSVSFKLYD